MKNVYQFLAIILFFTLIVSCEEESNLQPEGQWELSNPEIELPASNQNFVLDQITPNETITFSWQPATSSEGYGVTYKVSFHETNDTEFNNPLYEFDSGNVGKALSATISYQKIDEILAFAGFLANDTATINWAVTAQSLSKTTLISNSISVKRFEDEILPNRLFISGTATEDNGVLEDAMQMTRLTDSDGSLTNTHEVYVQLKAGEPYQFYSENGLPSIKYGGENGVLSNSGNAIIAEEDGVFRVQVDLDANTYNLFKIDFFSMVGEPINGGWGGDESLEYQGNGVWSESIDLISTGGFAFRPNGDINYFMKRVVSSQNNLIFEKEASSQGVSTEDIPSDEIGLFKVTLNLNSAGYSYSFERDNTVINPIITPDALFLFENGTMIKEFTKNGDVFQLDEFVPMQASASYTLNSLEDGSGKSYAVASNLAESNLPDADKVTDAILMLDNNTSSFTLTTDRALQLSFDFNAAKVTWTYYNIKLFHWDVWGERDEFLMTYEHPNMYKITTNITANYNMKFISPWDLEYGSESPENLGGIITNKGGADIKNINENGTFEVIISLENNYGSGSYQFVKQ